ncbi:ferritin [Bacteroidales bacterium OttesenSCG-928-I14]|nr:ferritin [Bacteroidales bacterium OttesenSCG-928-I14]
MEKKKTNKKGVDILSLDVEKLVAMLNAALAEEWLAYYQYWIGAQLVEGPMRSQVEAELIEHATEELVHADLLVKRIIELDGTPVLDPAEWPKLARCKYEAPTDPYVEVILDQNIRGERCAIQRYQEIAAYTDKADYVTHAMAIQILADEVEHEKDLEDFVTDITLIKEEWKKMRV